MSYPPQKQNGEQYEFVISTCIYTAHRSPSCSAIFDFAIQMRRGKPLSMQEAIERQRAANKNFDLNGG